MKLSNELKKAVMEVVMDGIKRSNYHNDTFGGRMGGCGPVQAIRMLYESKIRVKDNCVEQYGVKVAVIHRRYSQRKVRLCYKELKPTIEWLEEAA